MPPAAAPIATMVGAHGWSERVANRLSKEDGCENMAYTKYNKKYKHQQNNNKYEYIYIYIYICREREIYR